MAEYAKKIHGHDHAVSGETSWHMHNFDLPCNELNSCEDMSKEYYSLEDIRNGDWAGTTDTDYETHKHEHESKTKDHSRSKGKDNPYTKTYFKQGKNSKPTGATHRDTDPNKPPKGIRSPQSHTR